MGMKLYLYLNFFFLLMTAVACQANCQVFSVQHVKWLYIRHKLHERAQPRITDTTRPFTLDVKALVSTQFSLLKLTYYYQLVHKHRYSYTFSSFPNKRKRILFKQSCILIDIMCRASFLSCANLHGGYPDLLYLTIATTQIFLVVDGLLCQTTVHHNLRQLIRTAVIQSWLVLTIIVQTMLRIPKVMF